jgi:REP element-mobilizing transposase RayT
MANTYSQIYIQTVFAVDGGLSLIRPEFKEELYKYITGIVRNSKQKLLAINGMSDHVHILIGLKPSLALADLVQDIKVDSSKFINKKGGSEEGSAGRKDTGHSHTGTLS